MSFLLCRHIKTNGTQCKSPTLTGGLHCYFHQLLYRRHTGFRHTDSTRGYLVQGHHIELAPLEDRDSVQVALSLVINALATGQLETKRATALLYGLQLASMNANRLDARPFAPDVVRTVHSTPEGLELAEPGATNNLDFDLNLDDFEEEDFEGDENFEDKDDDKLDELEELNEQATPQPALTALTQTENGSQD